MLVGPLTHPDAHVAVDVVAAVAPGEGGLQVHHAEGLDEDEAVGHVAVVPVGSLLYVSGQAVRGDGLIPAMHESMNAELARLAYMGLSVEDIVQLKVFQDDMSRADEVEQELQRMVESSRGRHALSGCVTFKIQARCTELARCSALVSRG